MNESSRSVWRGDVDKKHDTLFLGSSEREEIVWRPTLDAHPRSLTFVALYVTYCLAVTDAI